MNKLEIKIMVLREAVKQIRSLIQQLPSGIDEDADSANSSPKDNFAHIGGLIWQICEKVLAETWK